MNITRGSLDGITRSTTSLRQRPGSRVSLQSSISSPIPRGELHPSGSLEILPPEIEDTYQDQDLALEEYLSTDDEESDADPRNVYEKLQTSILKLSSPFRASSQQETSYELDIHSEATDELSNEDDDNEEREQKQDATVTDEATERTKDAEEEDDLSDITDPALKKAIRKMRKLDKILAKKLAREKEVKRQRLMMHKQYQDELERIKQGLDRNETKDETENTSRFLALVPPPNHSEGLDTDDDIRFITTPVFQTQLPDGGDSTDRRSQRMDANNITPRSDATSATKDSDTSSTSKRSSRRKPKLNRGQNRNGQDGDADDMDFIQRNIQLACDAGSMIAMTDDEKKRVEDLLKDVEMLGEEPNPETEMTGFELQMAPGIGYQPSKDESSVLADIDQKLKALIPYQEFEQICSTPSVHSESQVSALWSREAFKLGEKILQDGKDARDQQDRMRRIEEELVQLQTQVENEISNPSLSKTELDYLFRQCDDVDTRAQSAMSSPRTPKQTNISYLNQISPRSDQNASGLRDFSADGDFSNHGSSRTTSRNDNLSQRNRYSEKLSKDSLRKLLEDAKERLGIVDNLEDSRELGDFETATDLETDVTGFRSTQENLGNLSSSGTPRTALVSHSIIQELLKNPRATLTEAQKPAIMDGGDERGDISDEGQEELYDDDKEEY